MDLSHLDALNVGLSHERTRLVAAKTEKERALRSVWVAQYEKQIADELKHLGIADDLPNMTDDELLAALGLDS